MGKRIEHNRKISSERGKKTRQRKFVILIASEGKNKTEKNYFHNFQKSKSPYNIVFANGNDTDPLRMVNLLIKQIKKYNLDLAGKDKAYCIFDTDINPTKNKMIRDAKALAKENNIIVITSSPCIEYWFYLHFDYTTASLTNKEVIKKLKKFYPKYVKNLDIYPDIVDKTDIAIKWAKKAIKFQIDNNKEIGTIEANPCTEIYKIIEFLDRS